MSHAGRSPSAFQIIKKEFGFLTLLAFVAILLLSFGSGASKPFVSSEVKFADPSKSGLAIVPASCESSFPHGMLFIYNGIMISECGCPAGTTYRPASSPSAFDATCVGDPPPSCVAYQGQACTTAGVCGTITGAYACDGSCVTGTESSLGGSKIGEWLIRLGLQSCPACASNMGSSCSSGSNSCGMVSSGAIQCNGTCTAATPSNSLCPPDSRTSCVANTGAACNSAPNVCGMMSPGTTLCSGACSSSAPSSNLCEVTCPEGYDKVGLSCLPPAGPAFEPFTITSGVVTGTLQASGHLEVRPTLVRSGAQARVFWNVRNVRSCTVTGTNDDGTLDSATGLWNVNFSGASGMLTSALTSRATYTLHCLALVGATPSSVTETKTVNIIPSWLEN